MVNRRWRASAVERRAFLGWLGGAGAALLVPSPAQATLVRGLTLSELTGRASLVVTLRALDSVCHYEDIGGRKSIVTDTLVRVEDVLAKAGPPQQELVVRTLGGRVGKVREILLGQPALSFARPDVAFLERDEADHHWFVGMAQGHYRLLGPTAR